MSDAGIWLGLLKWSLGQGDGTLPTEARELSDEDRTFLENVMKECVVDEPQRMQDIMKQCVELLDTHRAAENSELIENMMNELRDIIGQIDMAQTFVKFGGAEVLFRLMELEPLELSARSAAATALGTACQNNALSQKTLFETGALARLTQIFMSSNKASFRAKVLYAISCLTRGFAPAEESFVQEHSAMLFPLIAGTNIAESPNLWCRALYFASALVSSDNSRSTQRTARIAPIFIHSAGLLQCLRTGIVDVHEATLAFIQAVLDSPGGALFVGPHRAALDTVLAERATQISGAGQSKEDLNIEQIQHECMLLEDIIAQLDGRVGRRRQNSGAGIGGFAGETPSTPTLMIGPPGDSRSN